MKCKFYLYGFVFSALVALLIFVNSKNGLDKQETEIKKLELKVESLENQLQELKRNGN